MRKSQILLGISVGISLVVACSDEPANLSSSSTGGNATSSSGGSTSSSGGSTSSSSTGGSSSSSGGSSSSSGGAATCTDKIKNGTETDVDCGGTCPKCVDTKVCAAAADCTSGICTAGKCAAPTCTDTVKNGTEADVDCGGTCTTKCADTKACGVAADCASGVCTAGKCVASSCTDTVKNGTETDVDCGGTCTTKCADTKACAAAADCTSGVCTANKCVAPACDDTVKNGTESDVDCGGTCTTKCAIGGACTVSTDCNGAVCTGGMCTYATSCMALKTANAALPSGAYMIQPGAAPFMAYCDMTTDGGGWTLALKANGTAATFAYNQAIWTNTTLLNETSTDMSTTEAKLQPFTDMAYTAVRVNIVEDAVTRGITITSSGTSLLSTIAGPPAKKATTAGRAAWKSLMSASSLQTNCNEEGFNAGTAGYVQVRLGIVGNQENDCGSPDSWIGVGGIGSPCFGGAIPSVGNAAGCTPDNGNKLVPGFGYVFIR